eukprot:311523-Prymnesium_polylepis.1
MSVLGGSGERARTAQSAQFECRMQTHLLTGYHAGQLVATPPLTAKPVCTHAQAPMARGVICHNTFPASFLRAPGCPNASVSA